MTRFGHDRRLDGPHEEPAAAADPRSPGGNRVEITPERIVSVYAGPSRPTNTDQVFYVRAGICLPVAPANSRIADDESLEMRFFR